jgi:hypothetical protein
VISLDPLQVIYPPLALGLEPADDVDALLCSAGIAAAGEHELYLPVVRR